MQLTISHGEGRFLLAKPANYAPLHEPPVYAGDKDGPRYRGYVYIERDGACDHARSGYTVEATLAWDGRRYTATTTACPKCAMVAREESETTQIVRCKVTNWRAEGKGYGFAVPLNGQAVDVQTVFVHATALCSHLLPGYEAREGMQEDDDFYDDPGHYARTVPAVVVPRGTYLNAIGLTHDAAKGRHTAKRAVCDACAEERRRDHAEQVAYVAEQAKRDAANKRLSVLFAKGHRFNVGAKNVPQFYKPGGDTCAYPYLAAFEAAALKAIMTGATDEAVIQCAEQAARLSYDAFKKADDGFGVE